MKKNTEKIVKAAIVSFLALAAADAAFADKATSSSDTEKCYGIVKTAMNDCQTATASCAGSSIKDNQPDAFIFLPKGTCNKIVGGSLQPKTEKP